MGWIQVGLMVTIFLIPKDGIYADDPLVSSSTLKSMETISSSSKPKEKAAEPVPDPGPEEKIATQKRFELQLQFPQRIMDDCNPEATKNTLKFLSLTNKQLLDPNLNKETAGFEPDCALRKTDLDKLRTYLEKQGFLGDNAEPGSLVFVNAQDKTIKLDCKKNGRWTIKGGIDDNKFNEEGNSGKKFEDTAPTDAFYFRRYTCRGIEDKCSHTFYTITRPQPMVPFPLQAQGGQEIKIKCEINKCMYEKNEDEKCLQEPSPQPKYIFEWTVPEALLKKGQNRNLTCNNGPDDSISNTDGPLYIGFEGDKAGKELKEIKESPMKIELSKKKKTLKGEDTDIESTITITNGQEEHSGYYECIIIDGNGVPSIPSAGSLDTKHEHYTGRAKLHVRSLTWTYVPLVILLIMIVAMALIHFLCPLKMEHDDGTPYTKEEFVTPSETTAASPPPPPPSEAPPETDSPMDEPPVDPPADPAPSK